MVKIEISLVIKDRYIDKSQTTSNYYIQRDFAKKLPSFSADSSIFGLGGGKNSHDNNFTRKTIQPRPKMIHRHQLLTYLVAILVEYVRNIPPSSYKILGIQILEAFSHLTRSIFLVSSHAYQVITMLKN